MLNKLEKHGMLKCIGALMDVIGIILLAVSYFVDATTPDMVLKIIGLVFIVIGIYFLAFKNLKERLTKVCWSNFNCFIMCFSSCSNFCYCN